MKILLVTHHWSNNTHHSEYSGYQRLAYYLSKRNKITVLTWGIRNEEFYKDKIKIIIIKTPKNDKLFLKRLKLSKYAKKISNDYDLVHLLYSDCGFFNNKKIKYVTTVHNIPQIAKYNSIKERMFLLLKYFFIQKRAFKNSDALFVISTNLLNNLKKWKKKTVFIPHGIDVNFWKSKVVSNNIKEKYLNKKYDSIILSVGSHGVNKESIYNAITKIPRFLFIIVGLSLDNKYDNLLIKNNIPDNELRELYKISDVFFRPVDFATANNSILEAMSMELPIVTTKIEGIMDYLDNNSAYLANSPDEYVGLINETIDNKSKTQLKVSNARKDIEQKFCWEKICLLIENYYYNQIMKIN